MANEKQKDYWTHGVVKKWLAMSEQVEARFTAITPSILAQAGLKPGDRVLDIGCGPGTTALAAASCVGRSGHVTGIDISAPMLESARRAAEQAGVENIAFHLADAQTEPLAPPVDVLISRFGVMFFDDPVAAFKNLHQATKPQGRLVFAAWGPLAENLHWLRPLEIVQGLVGVGEVRRPHAPGPMAFADPDYVLSILARSGWRGATVTPTKLWLHGASLEDEAQMACLLGPSAALLEEKKATAEIVGQARTLFKEALPGYAKILPDGQVRLEATLNMIAAVA